MKRILSLGVATVGLVVGLGISPAGAAQGELAGTWTSVDFDGSDQTLTITGTGHPAYAMSLFDEEATTLCDGGPALASGAGHVHDDEVFMRAAAVCMPGGNRLRGTIGIVFTYDEGSDTLTDQFGVVWSRD